jgi:hypothetical protein
LRRVDQACDERVSGPDPEPIPGFPRVRILERVDIEFNGASTGYLRLDKVFDEENICSLIKAAGNRCNSICLGKTVWCFLENHARGEPTLLWVPFRVVDLDLAVRKHRILQLDGPAVPHIGSTNLLRKRGDSGGSQVIRFERLQHNI